MTPHARVQHIGKLTILEESTINNILQVDFTIFEVKPVYSENGDDVESWKVRKCRASNIIAQKILQYAKESIKVAVEGFLIDETEFVEGEFYQFQMLLTDRVFALDKLAEQPE